MKFNKQTEEMMKHEKINCEAKHHTKHSSLLRDLQLGKEFVIASKYFSKL